MDTIKRAADIGIKYIKDWLPGGKMEGHEYVVKNPTRADKKAGSFKINLSSGAWADFATNEKGGDAVSLYAYLNGLKQIEAAKEILNKYDITYGIEDAKTYKSKDPVKPQYKIAYPVSDFVNPPDFSKAWYVNKCGKYISNWLYTNKDGQILFYIARYEKDGKKDILPFVYCDDNKWRNKHFPGPRPLYNLYEAVQNTDKDILLVEGEKCAEIAQKILKDMVVVSWCGGSGGGAILRTDWEPIKNRRVYYWYDDDDPGIKTINTFTTNKLLNDLVIVKPPPESKGHGWDIADAIDEGFTDISLINHIYSFEKQESDVINDDIFPFQCLGFNNGIMYFLPNRFEQLHTVRQGGLTKNDLVQVLAPLEFWQQYYGYETKHGYNVAWENAINDVSNKIAEKGIFNADFMRGRGAYFDNDKVIIHTGKKIICDDKEYNIKDFKSKYTYERLLEMNLNVGKKANEFETEDIINCINKLSIENELQKTYLIGWAVLAPFCGALDWRPHIWINGPSGTGKTTIMKMILYPMAGDFSLRTNPTSSAAGLRQFSKNDRIPVFIDEAEPCEGLNEILKLIRSASSSSQGEKTYKGTQNHIGVNFTNQMMFCLCSVLDSTDKRADKSRFTFIDLFKNKSVKWPILERDILNTFTEENCKKIRGRTLSLLPVIRKNAKIFRNAITGLLKNQRAGDQAGVLIAGALSLETDKIFTHDEAIEYLKKKKIELSMDMGELTDEMRCFLKILQSRIDYQKENTTIMNLIHIAASDPEDNNYNEVVNAQNELLKYGIKYDTDKLYIALKYEWIEQILKNTDFYNNYGKVLKRLDFTEGKKSVRFGNYHRGDALVIPIENIIENNEGFERDLL